jgi:glyoxylase-like metal-dependent hydrolase (beta-lactamase superfamily II)
MQHERVSSEIHVFTSDLYVQVTAGLVVTDEGCILLDTLPFPEETAELAEFARKNCPGGVQQIVLTHYHSDHIYGTYQFPGVTVVSHALTRDALIERGFDALKEDQSQAPELAEVELILPEVVFEEGEMNIHLGEKTLRLFHSPGHTHDSVAAYVVEDKVLFAADTILPIPTIFDGDLDTLIQSIEKLKELQVDSMVQGHGEIILRGEVIERMDRSIDYLERIRDLVSKAIQKGETREHLMEHNVEEYGLSRIPLNGMVQQLHTMNLVALYDRMA